MFLVGLLGGATGGPLGWVVGFGALAQIGVLVALAVFVRRTARGNDGARLIALRLLLVSMILRALQWAGVVLIVGGTFLP